jgi:alcohol dehydrogenase YqhD (iron-dependent ADH family)
MVLINNQATCLSCGATPSPDVEPPEREEHHHHDHHHAGHAHEETKSEADDLTKLRILLPHWIEHNEEHAASFERWVPRARAVRQGETAQRIEEAVERMAACNQALRAALAALEG